MTMRRTTTVLTLLALAPALTGCVFVPALAQAETVPDEAAYLEAVKPALESPEIMTLMAEDSILETGYRVCALIADGMNNEEVMSELATSTTDREIWTPDAPRIYVEAAQAHLC